MIEQTVETSSGSSRRTNVMNHLWVGCYLAYVDLTHRRLMRRDRITGCARQLIKLGESSLRRKDLLSLAEDI